MALDREKTEFAKWWLWIVMLIVLTVGILGFTGAFGKVFSTAVEREVFEQSYQKQAGDRQRMNTWRAQLAQINSQLTYETDQGVINNLRAQKAMLEVQINSAR